MSERFLREHGRASPPLQRLAEHEVQFLQRRARSETTWLSRYDRVRGLQPHTVIELEVGGANRILAHKGEREVTLLAFGDHGIVKRYVRGRTIRQDLASTSSLPPSFRPGHDGPFFPPLDADEPSGLTPWGAELTPEWLYFLDEEQADVAEGIIQDAEKVLTEETDYSIHAILGGPGTGKTSILLHLLNTLSSQVSPTSETWAVGLEVSDSLAEYVTASTAWDLTETRRLATALDQAEVLLIDDPQFLGTIVRRADETRDTPADELPLRVVVAAFDPLQLSHSITDSEYTKFVGQHQVTEWRLSSSYRQKKNVGQSALRVAEAVAGSSPFLRAGKKRDYEQERASLTAVANALTFRNPSGYVKTYLDPETQDWRRHVAWIRGQRSLWRHWPALLVVRDEEVELEEQWLTLLDDLWWKGVGLSEVKAIKGLEYQHVMVILSPSRYHAVESGFTGSGRRLYDEYRLLRIPFSRAKDSLAVFVPSE